MQILLWSLILGLALVVLVKASKVFVTASEDTAKALGWSSLFIGVTIVAVGTSLPELSSSLWAAWTKNTSLVAANVTGSNIANILFILGLCAVFAKGLNLSKESMQRQISFILIATFLLIGTIYDGRFEWFEGVLMLVFYTIYAFFSIEEHKEGRYEALKNWLFKPEFNSKMVFNLVASALAMLAASYFTVHSIEKITSLTQILPSVLGASVLALGTSLPELTVAITAARKGNTDLAVGTLLGSNVFNICLVLALPSFIRTLNVNTDTMTLGIPFLLISTFLLLFALVQKRLSSHEGFAYVLLYILFIFQLYTSF